MRDAACINGAPPPVRDVPATLLPPRQPMGDLAAATWRAEDLLTPTRAPTAEQDIDVAAIFVVVVFSTETVRSEEERERGCVGEEQACEVTGRERGASFRFL